MAKTLGVTQTPETVRKFIGGHGTIEKPGTLSSTGAAVTIVAGQVLSKVGGKYVKFNPAGADGSQTPSAILMEDVDVPAAGDAKTSVYVHGEFLKAGLNWNGADAAQTATAIDVLAGTGIYVK